MNFDIGDVVIVSGQQDENGFHKCKGIVIAKNRLSMTVAFENWNQGHNYTCDGRNDPFNKYANEAKNNFWNFPIGSSRYTMELAGKLKTFPSKVIQKIYDMEYKRARKGKKAWQFPDIEVQQYLPF